MEAAMFMEAQANSWYNHYQCVDATERLGGATPGTVNSPSKGGSQVTPKKQKASGSSPLVNEIARAREQIKKSLQSNNAGSESGGTDNDLANQVACLKKENQELRKITEDLRALVIKLDSRVTALESGGSAPAVAAATASKDNPPASKEEEEDDDDDDFDPFASDSEEDDEAKEKERQARLEAYNAKKATKKAVIAKSSIIIDVKPWEAETDMKALEESVRSITMDGLLWGASKLVPVAFGVKKLQISCVIEDDKVSTDDLQEKIEDFEDFVQSTDIAAFNKI